MTLAGILAAQQQLFWGSDLSGPPEGIDTAFDGFDTAFIVAGLGSVPTLLGLILIVVALVMRRDKVQEPVRVRRR